MKKLFFIVLLIISISKCYTQLIVNPLDVSKISLEKTKFVKSYCDDSENIVFDYKTSWEIRVCNKACELLELNITSIIDQLLMNYTDGSIIINKVEITPLSELTLQHSSINNPTSGNPFSVLSNYSIIPLCHNDDPLDTSNTLFSMALKMFSSQSKKLGFTNIVNSNNVNKFLMFNDRLKDSQCYIDNTTCFDYKIVIKFSLNYSVCPVDNVLLTNNVNVNSKLCNCYDQAFDKYFTSSLDKNFALQQCKSNKTYCAESNATTIIQTDTNINYTQHFQCTVIEENCVDCFENSNQNVSNPDSNCQYSKVRCVSLFGNTGIVPIKYLSSVSFLPQSDNVFIVNLITASCPYDVLFNKTVNSHGQCCIGGYEGNEYIIDYCVQKNDNNQSLIFFENNIVTNTCNGTRNDFTNRIDVNIPPQEVVLSIEKTEDSEIPFVCDDPTNFPLATPNQCKNYTLTVKLVKGCLKNNLTIDTDLEEYLSIGANVNVTALINVEECTLIGNILHCTVSEDVGEIIFQVKYQICFPVCDFCRYANTPHLIFHEGSVANYSGYIIAATLPTTLVCPCPDCVCAIKLDEFRIDGKENNENSQGLSIEANGGSMPNHYYQGSVCKVYRKNDTSVLLGQFQYGAYDMPTMNSLWDCVYPLYNPINNGPTIPNNCWCNTVAQGNIVPHYLYCQLDEVVTIECCALPSPPPLSFENQLSGDLIFHGCDDMVTKHFECIGFNNNNFTMNGPYVKSLSSDVYKTDGSFNPTVLKKATIDCRTKGQVVAFQIDIGFKNSYDSDVRSRISSINSFTAFMDIYPPILGNYTLFYNPIEWTCSNINDISSCYSLGWIDPGKHSGTLSMIIEYYCSLANNHCDTSSILNYPSFLTLEYDASMQYDTTGYPIYTRSFSDQTGCAN